MYKRQGSMSFYGCTKLSSVTLPTTLTSIETSAFENCQAMKSITTVSYTHLDIIAATGVNPDTRVRDLTEEDVSKLREYIEHHCRVEEMCIRDRGRGAQLARSAGNMAQLMAKENGLALLRLPSGCLLYTSTY